jgi:hypothetical protein
VIWFGRGNERYFLALRVKGANRAKMSISRVLDETKSFAFDVLWPRVRSF